MATLELLPIPEHIDVPDQLRRDVAAVCALVPPLWDLRAFVAVNPFMGFSNVPIDLAAASIRDGLGGEVFPPIAEYSRRWRRGEFGEEDVVAAARRLGIDPQSARAALVGSPSSGLRWRVPVRTFAEWHDARTGSAWQRTVTRIVGRWCAVHAGAAERPWRLPAAEGLWDRWRAAAQHDRTLDVAGLRGFRMSAARLPADPDAAIAAMLSILHVDAVEREAYLYRLLGTMNGWASWYRRFTWQHDRADVGPVRDLLAILACMDAAVASLAPGARSVPVEPSASAEPWPTEHDRLRLALQEAWEDGFVRRSLAGLRAPARRSRRPRPDAQAVFCIDVRSEVMRRHLEAQSEGIETLGFAGFFGVALREDGDSGRTARCPVLLRPTVPVRVGPRRPGAAPAALASAWSAPGAAFAAAELLGLAFGARMMAQSAGIGPAPDDHEERTAVALPMNAAAAGPAGRADIAESILKFTGLGMHTARVVLLCGHGSHSANNPHAGGLQCGACGGHGGALNARVACALLNDRTVRETLAARGKPLPSDTWFLPAIHDTSTDEVRILDRTAVPASHRAEVARLDAALAAAAEATRAERAARMGIAARRTGLQRLLRRRAADWSETRPEFALAGNATFIAAPRERTRGVNFGGRAFLHEYDATSDPDGEVLRLILSAPVVVASWINLQYFASTVDHAVFGAGDKQLHHRIGGVGVVLGNGGDLRSGLPLQSVRGEDGFPIHDPLRLQVVIEAPTAAIDAALEACPGTRDLADFGWIRLFAMPPGGAGLVRYAAGHVWEPFEHAEQESTSQGSIPA